MQIEKKKAVFCLQGSHKCKTEAEVTESLGEKGQTTNEKNAKVETRLQNAPRKWLENLLCGQNLEKLNCGNRQGKMAN